MQAAAIQRARGVHLKQIPRALEWSSAVRYWMSAGLSGCKRNHTCLVCGSLAEIVSARGSQGWSVNAAAITGSAIILRYWGMNWQAEDLEEMQTDWSLHAQPMI